ISFSVPFIPQQDSFFYLTIIVFNLLIIKGRTPMMRSSFGTSSFVKSSAKKAKNNFYIAKSFLIKRGK
ncbi:hypothetical protein, partial [Aggregatibacter actinomycetemcomitans]|uniref:hypothetical protein n=1 Tax=Aggregatibacter actinomycetemcomitans TaxID=714 RepID=UPI000517E395